MMIDTHTHLNFEAFNDDWREVADRAVAAGIEKMIVVGTDYESSERAVWLANQHESLYASVGIHPHHARSLLAETDPEAAAVSLTARIEGLIQEPKVVAVGEMGLDLHYYKQSKRYTIDNGNQEEWERLIMIQRWLLIAQVQLAEKQALPMIIHSREAGDGVLSLIKEAVNSKVQAVFHCYEGSKKYAHQILESGYYLGFTGNVTYAQDRLEVAATVPMERLLVETDSPYLTPIPHRGLRNEPINVRVVASHLAKTHKVPESLVIEQTTENAKRLFQL
jgi:TatD DNase family protein